MIDFAEMVEDCRLIDPGFDGSNFTWAKNELQERLDRYFVSEHWSALFESTRVTNLPRIASDYGPILMRWKMTTSSTRIRAFRFQNMWVRHPNFMETVRAAWEQPTDSVGLLNLQIKMNRTKQALKQWNKEVFGNIHANLRDAEEKIAEAQCNFETNPSASNRACVNQYVESYILLLKMEEDFWRQKASLKWMSDGDRNTKFYHSWVKQKRVRLRIHSIQHNGREIVEEDEIKESAVVFFRELLAPTVQPSTEPDLDIIQPLPPSANIDELIVPPSLEEVKKTVINISGQSIPGPDGFTATFFHCCWQIVGEDLHSAILQFFQGAYLRRRSSPAPNVALKIDMAKAYDRVQCPFLLKIMKQMGFPNSWLSLIERCIGTCWFSILINGAPAGFFQSTRGLRQGDPISPALFVIAAEYLSKLLDRLILEISHLAYADDILIFTQADVRPIRELKRCLADYEAVSGQQINIAKSNFYIADNHEGWADTIQREGGFSRGTFPFLYLGVPIYRGVKRTDMFLFRQKIAKRINGWAHRHLSFGCRLTLIKSTLEAIPIHLFQAIEPTKEALKQLDQMLARFFWGSTNETRRTHWISWEQICLPTAEGGLGIRKFREVLRAFSIKLWWRYRENNSLWATYLNSKYCRRTSPLTSSVSGRCSAIWRRLSRSWSHAHPHIQWIIGEGKVLFWDDIWLGDTPVRELSLDERGDPSTRVADLWTDGHWDPAKLLLLHHQAGLPMQAIEDIISTPILDGEQDIPRWTLSKQGNFSLASTWATTRSQRPTIPGLEDLWNVGLTLSISIFIWRLLSNRIPVDTKLQWRKIELASRCLCCPDEPRIESLQHLFVQGSGAAKGWREFDKWFEGDLEPISLNDTIPERLEIWAKRYGRPSNLHLSR
ncbi:uncharacterized protein LOC125194951 [Salvia hispanica]|uniref:uncharacterized protein LOC125194951 n=1 Tax=Salvia hispanica TaxID=49212 RepID=UPI002008F792|nr:uncharacterized protein LOC125194951 [Salvia hispanica]